MRKHPHDMMSSPERIHDINNRLADLRAWVHDEATRASTSAPAVSKALGEVVTRIDGLIDSCGLPAVPLKVPDINNEIDSAQRSLARIRLLAPNTWGVFP